MFMLMYTVEQQIRKAKINLSLDEITCENETIYPRAKEYKGTLRLYLKTEG